MARNAEGGLEPMKTSEAFNKMVELGLLLGVKSIKDFPGAWLQKVDDKWTFAVNGHEEEMEVGLEGGMGVNLDPFNAAVWKNGWLAATLSPVGGVFVNAEEDEFIAALDRAIAHNGLINLNLYFYSEKGRESWKIKIL